MRRFIVYAVLVAFGALGWGLAAGYALRAHKAEQAVAEARCVRDILRGATGGVNCPELWCNAGLDGAHWMREWMEKE